MGVSLANIDVGSLLSGIGDLAKDIRVAITGKDAATESKILDLQQAINLAQIKVNEEEAKNAKLFVSGWRPFVGWVCGSALAYNYIVMPLIVYIAKWVSASAPAMPALDSGELVTLLLALLGLAGFRTVEKAKDVAAK